MNTPSPASHASSAQPAPAESEAAVTSHAAAEPIVADADPGPLYLPDHFRASDAWAVEAMRRYPFASIVSNADGGIPLISHVPLVVKVHADGVIELFGHVARANPHWQRMAHHPRALVSFQGPSAYLSPSVYPDLSRVPTWNYVLVDAEVEVELVHDAHHKDALLKRLIVAHEPAYAQQWRGLPDAFTAKLLDAIVGFRMTVTRLHAKFKLNQYRPESHAAMLAAYQTGTPAQRELAEWMQRLGITGVPSSEGHSGQSPPVA